MRYLLSALALGAVAAPAIAHHGWSSYDETKPITVSGKLTRLSWANPHGTATLVWRGKPWAIVLAPTARMEARGLTQAMIAPGKPVTLTGYARRDGTAEMRIERVTAAGRTVELR